MSQEEVDNTEAMIIDMYLIALEEVKGKGGANQEEDEIAQAFMG